MAHTSQSAHILELARELLADIELSRLDNHKIILKCSRLARLAGSEEVQTWMFYEINGYNSTHAISVKYLGWTRRWINREEKKAHYGSFSQLEHRISALRAQLAATQLPSISGEYVNIAVGNIMRRQTELTNSLNQITNVTSTVIGQIHTFVSGIYYEREFEGLAETIFEKYKDSVDGLIAARAGSVLTKIPSVIDRLSSNSEEDISQALTTCRRIIEAFADEIYPASDKTIELGGNTLKLDASKHQNRINAYIAERTSSHSRRVRLRQNLSNLFDRVSTGVHKDATSEEAFSLFLNVYLLMGEILHLEGDDKSPAEGI